METFMDMPERLKNQAVAAVGIIIHPKMPHLKIKKERK